MLPHNHFLIAGLVIAPVAAVLYPEKTILEISEWVLVGGLVSSAVDLDIVALVLLKSKQEPRLRPFRNPLEIYRKFKLFMNTITDTGVQKTALKTHLVFSVIILSFFYLFTNAYFVPVVLGIASHLLSDIPNVRRLAAQADNIARME